MVENSICNVTAAFSHNSIVEETQQSNQQATAPETLEKGLGDKPPVKYEIHSLGWNTFGSKHVYCTGDTVLGGDPESQYEIAEELNAFSRIPCKNSNPVEAFFAFLRIKNASEKVGSVLLAAAVLGILRQCAVDADFPPPCCIYLFGKTQSYKTTFVKLMTRFIQEKNGGDADHANYIRNVSSNFMMQKSVSVIKDIAFILDDLYRETDKRIRNGIENSVKNLIRDASDNAPRKSKNSALVPHCQLIVTAEYLFGTSTLLGRMLILPIEKPFDRIYFNISENEKDLIPAFYENFIVWAAKNYDDIVEKMRKAERDSRIEQDNQPRIFREFALLRVAYQVLLEYGASIGAQFRMDNLLKEFDVNKNVLLEENRQIIKARAPIEKKHENLSALLLEYIQDGKIKIGKKGDECYAYKTDRLRIKSKAFIKAYTKDKGITISEKALTAYFRDRDILETYKSGGNKRCEEGRYLQLLYTALKTDAERGKIDNYFY